MGRACPRHIVPSSWAQIDWRQQHERNFCDEEAADPQPVRDELRQPHHPWAVAAAGQQPRALQRHRVLAGAGAHARGRRFRRRVSRRCDRHLRHLPWQRRHRDPPGPADSLQRPALDCSGDGRRDQATGLWHHVLSDVRAAVRLRAADEHARSPHQWPGRLEHRDLLLAECSPQLRTGG